MSVCASVCIVMQCYLITSTDSATVSDLIGLTFWKYIEERRGPPVFVSGTTALFLKCVYTYMYVAVPDHDIVYTCVSLHLCNFPRLGVKKIFFTERCQQVFCYDSRRGC